MKKLFVLIICTTFFICNLGYGHRGRTDSYGGHYYYDTNGYHYHGATSKKRPKQDSHNKNIYRPNYQPSVFANSHDTTFTRKKKSKSSITRRHRYSFLNRKSTKHKKWIKISRSSFSRYSIRISPKNVLINMIYETRDILSEDKKKINIVDYKTEPDQSARLYEKYKAEIQLVESVGENPIVYINKFSNKYHTYKCKDLANTRHNRPIQKILSELEKINLACSKCNPPLRNGFTRRNNYHNQYLFE